MLAEAAPADTEDVVKPFEPEYDSLDTRLENEASVDDRDTIGLDEDGQAREPNLRRSGH